jgi:hypothetical protein
MANTQKMERSAARGSLHRHVRCFVRHESGLNILRPQERFSFFRDVLPERVGHIGRDVVPRFRGKPIEKGPVFIPDPAPREPPDRAIGRVAEQAFQGGAVGRPTRGVQHAQTKLKEAIFVAPDHRGHVTVQDEAILIGQTLAIGGARYDVTDTGIAQAREEFDVAGASSLLHQRSLVAIGLPYLQAKKEERNQNGNAAGK